MKVNFAHKRLKRLMQKLKALILQDLSKTEREAIKHQLETWEQAYLAQKLDLETYTQKALLLLCHERELTWVEQFLYREASYFLSQADIFQLCQTLQTSKQK